MSELLNCPFCGSEALHRRWVGDGLIEPRVDWEKVECVKCHAQTDTIQPYADRTAIAAWNRRATQEKPGTDISGSDLDGVMEAVWEAGMSALATPKDASTQPVGEASLVEYIKRQWAWSKETFGPALRTRGIIDHITKELREVEAKPHDLSEWVDIVILAMDGFWRHGGKPEDLLPAMQAKQDKNFARKWPDWRTVPEGKAIEHDRSGEAALATQATATQETT